MPDCVLVDGHDLATLDLRAWRRQIGWLPQRPTMFRGTVRENIALGDPGASAERVEAAAELGRRRGGRRGAPARLRRRHRPRRLAGSRPASSAASRWRERSSPSRAAGPRRALRPPRRRSRRPWSPARSRVSRRVARCSCLEHDPSCSRPHTASVELPAVRELAHGSTAAPGGAPVSTLPRPARGSTRPPVVATRVRGGAGRGRGAHRRRSHDPRRLPHLPLRGAPARALAHGRDRRRPGVRDHPAARPVRPPAGVP